MSFLRSKVRTFVYKRMTSFFLSRNIRIHHFVDHLWGHSFDDLSAPPPLTEAVRHHLFKAEGRGDDLHPMSWLFNSSWLVVMTSFCWRIPTSVRLFQVLTWKNWMRNICRQAIYLSGLMTKRGFSVWIFQWSFPHRSVGDPTPTTEWPLTRAFKIAAPPCAWRSPAGVIADGAPRRWGPRMGRSMEEWPGCQSLHPKIIVGYNVSKNNAIKTIPQSITIFIGGSCTIPRKMGGKHGIVLITSIGLNGIIELWTMWSIRKTGHPGGIYWSRSCVLGAMGANWCWISWGEGINARRQQNWA